MRKIKEGIYRSPARPGISYMLSPVVRLYAGPGSKETRLMNMPHYMFYAPNLTSRDFGGGPPMSPYPYLANPGPHAYMILNVGEAEKAKINRESQDLIKDLCAYRYLCLERISAGAPNRMKLEAKSGRVEVRLTESFRRIHSGLVTMHHTRTFFGASSRQVISLLLGLRFCGEGGLMVDSTADCEQDSLDGTCRFIKGFRPLGTSVGSFFAGSFDVHSKILECCANSKEARLVVCISFSPARPKRSLPVGSFLWEIEPSGAEGAFWRELINTDETRGRQIPDLRVPRKWVFLYGHNRLVDGAARRIVEVLNARPDAKVFFAKYAEADGYNFWPKFPSDLRSSGAP